MQDVVATLALAEFPGEWDPPVLATDAVRGDGVEEMWEAVLRHRAALEETGALQRRRGEQLERQIVALVTQRLERRLSAAMTEDLALGSIVAGVRAHETDPLTAVDEILAEIVGFSGR